MIHYLRNLKLKIPEKQIFARLGYKHNKTKIDEATTKQIKEIIEEALVLIEPQGAYIYTKITAHNENVITLDCGLTIKSKQIAKLLQHSQDAVILAGTIGPSLGEQVKNYISHKNLTNGTILDAIGSELADEVANQINTIIKQEAFLKKQETTFRYSPGYGDWGLEAQNKISSILETQNIGLIVNSSHILVPEKSVTAILGLTETEHKNYCSTC